MSNLLLHKIASLVGHKQKFKKHEQSILVFYLRKRTLAVFIAAVITLLLAIHAISVTLSATQSQAVFQPENPIRSGNGAIRSVAIAVNVDWGEEYLPDLLASLRQHHTQATFFITGRWAEENAAMVRRIAQDGLGIGNHGYSHPHVNGLTLDENIREIARTEDVLLRLTGRHTQFFAPPYGEYNDTVLTAAARSNLRTVLWSIDTVDWQNPSTGWIVSRIRNMSHNGAIILMHPTPVTVKVLPDIIKTLSEQGYEIVPLEKLLSD